MSVKSVTQLLTTILAGLLLFNTVAFAQTSGEEKKEEQAGTQRTVRSQARRQRNAARVRIRRQRNRVGRRTLLDLTDGQKQQLAKLRTDYQERTRELRSEIKVKRGELRQLREGDSFNEPLALQKLTEIARLEARLMGEEHRLNQDTMATLTAEQKALVEQGKARLTGIRRIVRHPRRK